MIELPVHGCFQQKRVEGLPSAWAPLYPLHKNHNESGSDGEYNQEVVVDEVGNSKKQPCRGGQLLIHTFEKLHDHGNHIGEEEEEHGYTNKGHYDGVGQGGLYLTPDRRTVLKQVCLVVQNRIECTGFLPGLNGVNEKTIEYPRVSLQRFRQ